MSIRTKSLRPPSERGQTEEVNFSDSSQNLSQRRFTEDKLVKLNVGGRKFDTTESTLLSRGTNFLSALVTSHLPSLRDDEGRYFIDRSGAIFDILIEFLRTGILTIPPSLPREAVAVEADYYGINLPIFEPSSNKIAFGLFVSSKYAENEIVIFSDICTGYIVRGGSSKVQFRYRTDGDRVIEVVWQTEKKPRAREKPLAASSSSPTVSRSSGKRSSERASSSILALSREAEPSSSPAQSDDGQSSFFGTSTGGYTKSTIWFLQDKELITSASNVYTFAKNITSFPSSIYTNSKSGIAIYDGVVSGFRLPRADTPPPILLSNAFKKTYLDESPDSPPPHSPTRDYLESIPSDGSECSEDSRDAVFVDIRNQWVKCEFSIGSYCDSVVAYNVVCRPIESVRYKSSLPFPFGGSNEYEWCREAFTLELIVLEDHLIARLVSYNLIRKDRSLVTMQYSAAFHKFHRQGSTLDHHAEP